jgi:heterodisulfide reductase subunit B
MAKGKYLLFMGCTIPARARNYELSSRAVAKHCGIEFVDEPEFFCCGFPIKNADFMACTLMAARNIAIAEKKGLDICSLCSACTGVMAEVNEHLKHDEKLRKEVNDKLAKINPAYRVEGKVAVKHFARVLCEDVGTDGIKERVKKPLETLRVAPHYGCHYLKPSNVHKWDAVEDPQTLDQVIRACGAESVQYADKKFCCGGALLAFDQDTALSVGNHKLETVKDAGADAMTLICPFCAVMYDDNQRTIEAKFKKEYGLPVLYLPQLVGMAMGIPAKDLGLQLNKVKTAGVVAKAGVA